MHQWVEAQHDGLCVLISSEEGVAQVHEECVTSPPEAILDVRVQEPGPMEEVGSRDVDGVAGPDEQILVPGRNVEHFVCDVPQEDSDLRGHDEASFTRDVVAIDRRGVVRWRAEVTGASDDVQAGLGRAKPMRVRPAPVGQCLAVVIVLLFAEAQRGEGDVAVGNGGDVM